MRSIKVFFESPVLLLLLIPVCALVFGAWRLWRRQEGEQRVEKLAMALRMLEAVLLVVIVSGFGVVTYSGDSHTVVLLDQSVSMEAVSQKAEALAGELAAAGSKKHRIDVKPFAGRAEDGSLMKEATDLAAAIGAAADTMEDHINRRIILLSDGAATDGDLADAAQRMTQKGVRIDAVHFDTAVYTPEAQMDSFTLPADAAEGERFLAQIAVSANAQMQGTLCIYDGEAPVCEQPAQLQPGKNDFEIRLSASGVGEHLYRAVFSSETDTLSQNNSRMALVQISSSAKVLLVDGTGSDAPQLGALLTEGGYAVDTVQVSQLPDTVSALCEYGVIVLMNVDAGDLPEGSAERLEEYVSQYGRSLLTTGGENTYIYGAMKDTPLEGLLPVRVSVEEKESVDPVALMLVIDVTDSMTRQSSGTPIEMARRGAIKCVDALNANDYAGVITFSDDAEVLVEMTSMENKDGVISAINGIKTDSPDKLTKFTDALETACETLKAFDKLDRKHIIFITDGSPADGKNGFDSIVKEMRANGITLSTIAVGRIMNVVKLLEGLSAIGGGRCYFVEGASDLPDIMSTDTVLSQVEYTIDEPFIPETGASSFADGEEEPLMQLYGYIRATAKAGVQTALHTPEGRPIYAQHRKGEGIAASFMSDLSGNWSRAWFASEKGKSMILKMIKALTPDTLARSDADIRFEAGGAEATLHLRNEIRDAKTISAVVTDPDEREWTSQFEWMQEDIYTCRIPIEKTGVYRIKVVWQGHDGAVLHTLETAAAHAWPREYGTEERTGGARVLMELAGATGGVMAGSAQELLSVDLGTTPREHDTALPLSILIMAAMLCDIAVRKTKLKRLRSRLRKEN